MNTLVILAGGASSRMKNSKGSEKLSARELAAANAGAKCLIVLEGDDRPVLDYLIKNAQKAGFTGIVLITSEENSAFKKWYGDKAWNEANLGLSIHFAVQKIPKSRIKPHGTADALHQALVQFPELQTEEFTVSNSDNLYSVKALLELQKSSAKNAFIAYDRAGLEFPAEKIARFALCKLNTENELLDIVEKPDLSQLEDYRDNQGVLRVSMNVFKFFGPEVFTYLENCPEHPDRKEKELPTAIMNMIHQSEARMLGIALKEHVPDLTTKADIAVFRNSLRDQYES